MMFDMNFFRNKKILITGASGLIGSRLRHRFFLEDCHLVCQSMRNVPKNEKNKKCNEQWYQASLDSPFFWEKLLYDFEPDIIFNLAAQTSHYECNKNISKAFEINTLPLANLIETLRQKKIFPTLINVGTATQVGLKLKLPVSENAKDNPLTIYDISKLASEHLTNFYANLEGGSGCTMRLCNVYGFSSEKQHSDRGVLNKFIWQSLNSENIKIYGDGNFIRDYVYVEDVIDAFIKVAQNSNIISGKTYLVGSGVRSTLIEAAKLVLELAHKNHGSKSVIEHISPISDLSTIDFRDFIADVSLISGDINWVAKTTLRSGLEKTMLSVLRGSAI